MSAAARAEARRKAILARGGDRLAKLTTSGRGEDNPVYAREREFAENYTTETPRVRSRVSPNQSPSANNARNANGQQNSPARNGQQQNGGANPFGMPDPSAWSQEQQSQFLQALMGGMTPPLPPAGLGAIAGAGGAGAAPVEANPFAGMPGMENSPFAAMMQMAAAAGGGGAGAFPPMGDAGMMGNMGGKAPDVAPPKTLVQRLMPAVHLVSVWALLMYFVLVMEPAAHGASGDGVVEPGGFAWRWKQLAGAKGTAFASGWAVQVLPFFWAFVTLELVLHSLRIFSGFDAFRPPTLLALALPHLPPPISAVIVHGMKYMQMGSMFLDDVAGVIVGLGW
ncbi:hypothetical protein K438DRAFT_1624431 [Mycena galopus ATCC 62051]|nr:hypothetical protein K438DRAFT_1624431 [Mycena galopus ATCC 62051]